MHHFVDDRIEKIAVVGDEQQRTRIGGQPIFQPHHRIEVEVIGWLIEQQKIRTAHQCLREVQTHPPAAGKLGDRARLLIFIEAETRQQ